jgi:UDP-2,3-diacylglucosamine pyrophosphatase LpxH
MRVALVSDCHLGGPTDPNQARLLAFLDGLEVDRLCLLGDVFQAWWHFGRAPFPAYAPVVAALRRFQLTFVPGNHDFHAGRYFAEELGAEVGAVLTPTWDGLATHLSHGDAADTSVGYRLASAVLRGRPFAMLVDAMGPERAWRFLGRIAGTPGGAPDPALISAQAAVAAEWLRQRPGLVVVGHTHAPGVHALPGGALVNLGDWVRWHTWLLVEDGRPTLYRHRDGRDEPFAG